jgi:pilus assembly protein CpaC
MHIRHVALATLLLSLPLLTARAEDGPTPAVSPPPAPVRHTPAAANASGPLTLDAGNGRVFHTRKSIANLFVADPKVAEARPASPNSVFVFGVGAGRTTVAAMDEAGNVLAQYDVIVRPSSYGAGEAAGAIRRALPGSHVRMSATPNGMVAEGALDTPAEAERAADEARSWVGEKQHVDNRTTLNSSVQVTLRVRIAEIDRNITRQLGINWTALANFGHFNVAAGISDGLSAATNLPNTIGAGWANGTSAINTVLDLLAQDQLITMLAEPNLTARSGETASFLAGGEFPIPIAASNGTITVEFKQYGVSLAFVPTVLSDGRISLHVRPEVSELSSQGAVSLPVSTGLLGTNTITIPAITVRRADTTVELGSGQSFAVAGLLQTQDQNTTRGLPYLGELPVIGTLFKSNMFLNNKSELVIVVTPYIVGPVSVPGGVHTPTDDFVPAGDVDRNLFLRQRARGTGPNARVDDATGRTTPTSAGFILP